MLIHKYKLWQKSRDVFGFNLAIYDYLTFTKNNNNIDKTNISCVSVCV